MIRLLFILCVLCASGVRTSAADLDVGRMADALGMKETGLQWDGQPGPAGELSAYQITAGVWSQHMRPLHFSQARNPELARLCAVRHLRWLIQQIGARGLSITPQRVATAWHYGLSRARGRTQWGLEVANLYNDLP
jgi:hypothetical protein